MVTGDGGFRKSAGRFFPGAGRGGAKLEGIPPIH